MRVLFSALAAPGHLFPLLPLARALRGAGHQVSFATGAEMGTVLTDAGFDVVTAGMGMPAAFAEVSPGVEVRALTEAERLPAVRRVFGEVLPKSFTHDLVPIIDDRHPDLVISEIANSGAVFAAWTTGTPVIMHGFGPIRRRMFSCDRDDLTALAARIGVSLPDDDHGPLRVIDICPPSLRDPHFVPAEGVWAMRPVPYGDPEEDVPEVPGDGPLIYLTLGTAFADPAVFGAAIAGLAALGARVLVACGPRVPVAALGAMPTGVVARPWVNQRPVLDRSALVVHHGGSGTTLAAAGAGVPQLIWPQGADQYDNADAVVRAGTGARFGGGNPTALTATAAAVLVDPDIRRRAGEVAAEVADMTAPEQIAARLEQAYPR